MNELGGRTELGCIEDIVAIRNGGGATTNVGVVVGGGIVGGAGINGTWSNGIGPAFEFDDTDADAFPRPPNKLVEADEEETTIGLEDEAAGLYEGDLLTNADVLKDENDEDIGADVLNDEKDEDIGKDALNDEKDAWTEGGGGGWLDREDSRFSLFVRSVLAILCKYDATFSFSPLHFSISVFAAFCTCCRAASF